MTQPVSIADLMAQSGVAFGTSGARGLVSAMTDRICFAYTCGFLQHLEDVGQFAPGSHVAIAGDLRPSSPRIMAACAAAIRHKGGHVDFCGFAPSPAVAAYGFERGIASLMVTGSHIPDDRNGIKFNRTDGEVLKSDELGIRAQTISLPDLFDHQDMLREFVAPGPLIDVATAYVARYVDAFGAQALKGLKLGVYEHSAVGRDILAALVEKLGGELHRLGRSERFIPVDTEAVRPEDQAFARQWSTELGLDAILSTDGDSDRPLLADESGAWIRGDILGILCARALGIKAVATPVSSNSAVELSGLFDAVRRTRIGSPFVIEAMNALAAEGQATVCGYEANGGFLLGSAVDVGQARLAALPTRDAVLPIIATLVDARRQGLPLSALQAQLPTRYTFSERLQNYPTAQSQALIAHLLEGDRGAILTRLTQMFGNIAGAADTIDTTDGLRIRFEGDDIIHLRPSGNAPELRCYTESDTSERAAWLNEQSLRLIAEHKAPA
ncbi:phosphomannomutase [Sphingobium sp. TA15]|uniref:Phosphomannomutase n=1 Tax=Sphingobium indicum (strain DSM 16413 / CCM 7287 / MTCC 6362 / UT26 / NBRC 101211 / UT26S) TaxID=452662 RepID=D4Z5G5_SPHIU|nr:MULTISPECIES: phosphomannomutase [Sphingobium]WDA38679.1 phosphomannomutase [Sphingobium sp. YC-XJ3]BAI97847.1 phosphomannomutase [Sphingobium indicum UT26S]BDD67238.1 phosphomannomutase [Sphingobium sp. TA15]